MHTLQDVVPWSIIYGAQNTRHTEELGTLKQDNALFVVLVMQSLMHTYFPCDTMQDNERFTNMWTSIRPYVTKATIHEAMDREVSLVLKHSDPQKYPYHERALREAYQRRAAWFLNNLKSP